MVWFTRQRRRPAAPSTCPTCGGVLDQPKNCTACTRRIIATVARESEVGYRAC